MIKNIILIGCGIHYRERYHSVLEKKGVEIALLIDLKANEEIIRVFFHHKKIGPKQWIFLEESYRNQITIEGIEKRVEGIDLKGVDAVLISTEPKVRKPYALWSAKRGLHLFMDKPITAFSDPTRTDLLETDFNEILEAVNQSNVRAVVSCERRSHLGYEWLKEYIRSFMLEEKVPITGIDIHFAGGIWKTPTEYLFDENHPFSYGYGILLHSGYHYVDLLVQLLALNPSQFSTDEQIFSVLASEPLDQLQREGGSPYKREDYEAFGEVDFLMIGQALKERAVVTNFAMKLFGTSLSMRKQADPMIKLEGRVRQEKITLHFGHLASIHISSIPYSKLKPNEYPVEDFSIAIMNSPLVKNREPLITLTREDFSKKFPKLPLSASMNGFAREQQLEEFLENREGNSPLCSHKNTMVMLKQIYSKLKKDLCAG